MLVDGIYENSLKRGPGYVDVSASDDSCHRGRTSGRSHGSCTTCLTASMCRCAASLALEASDDMYMVIAFFDEIGFAKQHRNYRIRPQTLGAVLVSYCSAGDGGMHRTESWPKFSICLGQSLSAKVLPVNVA